MSLVLGGENNFLCKIQKILSLKENNYKFNY